MARAYQVVAGTPTVDDGLPPDGIYPYLLSLDFGTGRPSQNTLLDEALDRGHNGWTQYLTVGDPLEWNSICAQAATDHGSELIHLQLTSRNYSNAGMDEVCANVPDVWRPWFRYNYFQEPEDNLEGDSTAQANYRATVASAATRIRVWNAANPTRVLQMPWLELAEFSLKQVYVDGNFLRSPDKYRPASSGDYDGVLWSIFQYGENASLSVLQAQVDRIALAMDDYFPGKPWGIMGSCYNLEPNTTGAFNNTQVYSSTQKNNQALWLTECYDRCRAAGCSEVSWYNVNFYQVDGNANGESRIEKVAETLAAFQALDRTYP